MRSSGNKVIRCFYHLSICLLALLCLNSCFYRHHREGAWDADSEQADSVDFFEKHHYTVGYTFVVQADSLSLCTEIPSRAQFLSVAPDSVMAYSADELIVSDFCIVPEDSVDSVWVKVARDQATQGWLRETTLLPSVSPDDPISIAIYNFSGNHVWGTFSLMGIVLFVLSIQFLFYIRSAKGRQGDKGAKHFFWKSIYSPYPTLLRIVFSGSAVFYSSIQLFAPHMWSEFYFHPTLNPFAVPPLLGAFLFSVWIMLLFFFATLDDAFRQLSFGRFMLYMLLTITVLAILYLFFSLTTLVYLGYPLYLCFLLWSLFRYFKKLRPRFRCGKCGKPFHARGICPHCGSENE